MNPVSIPQVSIQDEFWAPRQRLVRDVVVPYQWEALNDLVPGAEPSGTIANFKAAAGELEAAHHGFVFQDSDLAKWLETVGFVLQQQRNEALEALADSAIELIGRAQMPNGYLGTFYQLQKPGLQWTNVRDDHEMYNAGHFMEAAVAYYEATGKPKALEILCKFADHIAEAFGPEETQKPGYCGHPEIELALVKLYRLTGNTKYLAMSKFFIDERGREPLYFDVELAERQAAGMKERVDRRQMAYFQSHAPIRKQQSAEGHAVRAVYLFAGATDIADEYEDSSLLESVRALWNNTVQRRMYVTGGIGSSDAFEAFSFDYDLPNERAYAETCAAIGLMNWGHRLLQIEADSKYADIMERTLYNGLLSGISLDGRSYFYVNPLEVWPVISGKRDDIPGATLRRQPWFGCACCPPNIARLIASLGRYIYSVNEEELYVHLYIGSRVAREFGGRQVTVTQRTEYPWNGVADFQLQTDGPVDFTLALRLPGWCNDIKVKVNGQPVDPALIEVKGYAKLRRAWNSGDRIQVEMAMPVELVRSHPELREAAGKVAVQRGPIVYCMEEADNGGNLRDVRLSSEATFGGRFEPELLNGVYVLESDHGWRTDASTVTDDLYVAKRYPLTQASLRFIPYYAWANRSEGEMAVWVREK
ncbi:glycoside hydrolase family 127 protein [Cohnella cholangitidis]|uniref:Glycoside hydrolase family 127 protein n=2 Tax=Cohnella cholangitidis TaxID=2598458 RepID=A0A7G5C7E8_9BACL|nr:glycoside hydrolase family 127 protein [Cohnella cholangitidis]